MNNPDLFAPIDSKLKEEILKLENPTFNLSTPSYWSDAWMRLKAHRLAMLSLWVLLGIAMMAILGPMLSSHHYYETQLHLKNQPPNGTFWFGTDELGRDLFSRCWWGARISLFVGFTASFIDLIIGVLYGAIAGFMGGKVDEGMMRIVDVLNTIPYLLLVILLTVMIGPGLLTVIIALTLTRWIHMARVVRGQILQLKQQDFVKAAYALGASRRRIIFQHLIPNALGPIFVTLSFTIPSAIFGEAFLSFLGLGVQAPVASWGALAYDGLAALRFYPWRLFFPSLLIYVTILSLNLLADGLQDIFDPKLTKTC